MSEAKPFASLSSGLLARKGAAKPAMRPQGFGQLGMNMEDLGWNDMGLVTAPEQLQPVYEEEPREHVPSSIAALTPAPRNAADDAPEDYPEPAPSPVFEQQRAIEASFAPAVAARPQAAPPAPRQRAEASGRKAAFTLRLDAERHLKLRLACAVSNRSAQQLVSQALDAFLESLPEINALAGRVPTGSATNSR